MSEIQETSEKIVTANGISVCGPAVFFALIADPARQPEWDGNDNLGSAPEGHRIRGVGESFSMILTNGQERTNRVVEFEEGRRIAWKPAPLGGGEPGHLWCWELEPLEGCRTRITHTYDWSGLNPADTGRTAKAAATTPDMLEASIRRLIELAESPQARR